MKTVDVLTVLLIVGVLPTIGGQTAGDFLAAGRCELFEQAPTSCQAVLNSTGLSSIWTAPRYGLTQEYFAGLLHVPITDSAGRPLTTPLDFVAAMPYECGAHYLRLICPTFLRSCTVNGSTGAAVPLLPCQSVCNETNAACARFFAERGLPPLACDRVDTLTGGPLYPVDGGPVPCLAAAVAAPVEWVCPPPLQFVAPERGADILTGLPCALPCHELIYVNSNQLAASNVVWLTLNWISLVLSVATLVIFLSVPRLRAFPYRTAVYIAIAVGLFHMGFVGNTFAGLDDTLCDGDYNLRTTGWCKAQVFFTFGPPMFSSFWWVYQSFLVFWSFFLRYHGYQCDDVSSLQRWEPLLVAVTAAYALMTGLLIQLVPDLDATGGNLSGFPFCTFLPNTDTSSLLVWLLWMLPHLIGALTVFVLISATLVRLLRTADSWSAAGRLLSSQVLMLVYAADFLWVVATYLAFKTWGELYSDQVAASFADYYACLLTTFGMPADCPMTHTSPGGIYWNCVLCFSTVGTVMFIFTTCRKSTRDIIAKSMGYSDGDSSSSTRSGHAITPKTM